MDARHPIRVYYHRVALNILLRRISNICLKILIAYTYHESYVQYRPLAVTYWLYYHQMAICIDILLIV